MNKKVKWARHLVEIPHGTPKGGALSNGLFRCPACWDGYIYDDFDEWDSKICAICEGTNQIPKRLLDKYNRIK